MLGGGKAFLWLQVSDGWCPLPQTNRRPSSQRESNDNLLDSQGSCRLVYEVQRFALLLLVLILK